MPLAQISHNITILIQHNPLGAWQDDHASSSFYLTALEDSQYHQQLMAVLEYLLNGTEEKTASLK